MLLNFLSAPSASFALGATLVQTIFDAGRLRSQVDVSASRERELVESYGKAILAALADVESACLQQPHGKSGDAAGAGRGAVPIALRLAEIRYREGVDDLLTVLDAQRTLFQAATQTRPRLQPRSDYQALGAGSAFAGLTIIDVRWRTERLTSDDYPACCVGAVRAPTMRSKQGEAR